MTPIRGILFDLDGVLWHSSQIHAQAYHEVCQQEGLNCPPYELLAGIRTEEAFENMVQTSGKAVSAEKIKDWVGQKRRRARELLRDSPPLVPGCALILDQLARRLPLALATSASRGTAQIFLEHLKPHTPFRAILTGEDVVGSKPLPEIYLRAAHALSIEPADALVVEDAPAGIEAGRRAGARVIAIEGTASAADLRNAGASQVIRSLSELWGLL